MAKQQTTESIDVNDLKGIDLDAINSENGKLDTFSR